MASDRIVILNELERAGWSLIEDRGHWVAAHDQADRPLHIGGRFGWNLAKIRTQAAQALGKTHGKPSRRHVERRQALPPPVAPRVARKAAPTNHLGETYEQWRNRKIAEERRYLEFSRLMGV